MMIRSKTLIAGTILLVATLLSGCSGEMTSSSLVDSEYNSSSLSNVTSNSSTVSISDGEIRTTIDESKSFPSKAKIYNQKRKNFSDEQLLALFDGEPQKKNSGNPDYIVYETNEQNGFLYDEKNLTFYTKAGDLYDSVYTDLSNAGDYTYLNDTSDLNFAPRDEALEQIRKKLQNDFEIAPNEWEPMEFFAVTKDGVDHYKKMIEVTANASITENESSIDFDERAKAKERFDEIRQIPSEDFYYIKLKFKIDDIPVFWNGVFNYGANAGYTISGPEGYLVYTKSGIEYIALYFLNETDNSAGVPEESELIGVDKAKELLLQKYNDIIFDGEIAIYDVDLVYMPMPQNNLGNYYENFETRPFYVFYGKQTQIANDKVYTFNFTAYYDAVTGKDLGVQQG